MIDSRPNIVVIVADDLGYGDLGVYGNEIVRTPHIDRLAERGVTLTQHYSASPMCAPARAGLLTGRYPHRTGAVDVPSNRGLDRIALSETTIADVFKSAGYATGMVGKWHNGAHDMRYHPNARGFDEFAGFLNGGMDYYKWVLDYNGSPRASDGRHLTDVFSDEASAFIDRHTEDPFFLYVAYNAPHLPLQAPDELVGHYTATGELTRAVSTLYAMVEQVDAGIGRISDALERNGLADNTVVLFTSDNGPMMGGDDDDNLDRYNGRFSGSKGDVLEGGVRVPAIVSWPAGLSAGQQVDDIVHFCDWLPTLAGIAGADLPDDLDGRDATAVLKGEESADGPVRFWQWNRYEPVAHCNAAMLDGPWKLYWSSIPEARVKDPADTEPYEQGLTEGHEIMDIDTTLPDREVPRARSPQLIHLDSDLPEAADMSRYHPARVTSMIAAWDAWFEEVLAEWREARASTTS